MKIYNNKIQKLVCISYEVNNPAGIIRTTPTGLFSAYEI